jgi:hypothetical protein
LGTALGRWTTFGLEGPLFRAPPRSVSKDVPETLGGHSALTPFQEEVGARGTYPILDLGLERAKLQVEKAEHELGFPFLAAFLAALLAAFFPDLSVPTVDVFSQHGFDLL